MWPVLVTIPLPFGWGSLPIPAFGFMVVIAFLTAITVTRRLARREGVPSEKIEAMFTIMLLGAVVGGRLFHVLTNLGDFKGRWLDVFRIDKGGMVMYGGLIAVVGGGIWYLRRHKLPLWRVADAGAVAGALGLGLGRIGCLLAGCDFGKPVDPSFPLAVRFPSAHAPGNLFGLTVPPNVGHLAPDDHWVHPTQVYLCAAGIVTSLLLYWLYRNRRFPGQVFAAFLVLKPTYRFIVEFFRGDADRGFIGPLSQAQLIGILLAAAGVVLWVVLKRRTERPPVRPPDAADVQAGAGA